MRIISQNGSVDLAYEHVGIAISATDGTTIIAFPVSITDDTYWELAEYSTKEKAAKAVEMLRTEYLKTHAAIIVKDYFVTNYPKVFQFPPDREV